MSDLSDFIRHEHKPLKKAHAKLAKDYRMCCLRHARLRLLARDLIYAVKANELQVSSNDLGNALDALEEVLEG